MMQNDLYELAEQLGMLLLARGHKLALAESCTGGWAAQAVTAISGSSAWFDRGFVTYSNAAKVEMLGVTEQTLLQYGAVSEQAVREMAQGALARSRANIAAAISGIAGPDGGTPEKPVGTVCIAADVDGIVQSFRAILIGDRHEVRQRSAQSALSLVRRMLLGTA